MVAPELSGAVAQDLSGQKGKVQGRLPRGTGPCAKAYKEYVAAKGHSAYASTPIYGFGSTGYICGHSLNRRTTQEAEARAVAGCVNGTRKWKRVHSGECEVRASK